MRFSMVLVVAGTSLFLHQPVLGAITLEGCPAGMPCPGVGTNVRAPSNALQVCPEGCPYSTIQAAIDAAETGDTITVAPGTYKENLIIQPPVAAKTLRLLGSGSSGTVVDGDQQEKVLEVDTDYSVTISDMSFTNGRAFPTGGILNHGTLTLIRVEVTHNEGVETSGGIANDVDGTLTILDCKISDNLASDFRNGQGGGFLNFGKATVTDSLIIGNTAMAFGGGIENQGDLSLINTRVTKNTVPSGVGGGIENHKIGTLTMTNSPVSGNVSFTGGGIFNAGALSLSSSPIFGNAAQEAGGLENSFTGAAVLKSSLVTGNTATGEGGGGIFNDRGTLTLIDSPLAGNRAQPTMSSPTRGGGLSISGGRVTLISSPVRNNQAIGSIAVGGGISIASVDALSLTNSPVTGNEASTDGGGMYSFASVTPVQFDRSPVSGNEPNNCVNVPGC